MNETGQFLLYDALLAIILIILILIAMTYIINQEEDYLPYYNTPLDTLESLSTINVNGDNILISLEEGDNIANETLNEILSDKSYQLIDLSTNKTLYNNYSEFTDKISARKVIGGHEFELILFI